MTIASNTPRIQPTTDGTTASFVCTFPILDKRHLRVFVGSRLQVEGADYALSGLVEREGNNGYESGFTVTMLSAPADDEVLTIYRDGPETQETRFYPADPFLAEVPERSWDKLTTLCQELATGIGLIVKPDTTGSGDGGETGQSPTPTKVGNAILMGITKSNDDGTYSLVEVEWDGFVWYALDQPIVTADGAEINGCADPQAGDVVIAFPFTNSTGGISYRFEHAQSCIDQTGNPAPDQSSDFYLLVDCDATAPDIVTSANLTRLVGKVVSVGGVCYTVSETADGTGAVTGVSIASAWSTCGLCSVGDAETDLPELPNVYAQMARCSDDELVDLWIPEIQFGLEGDEDLTKIYALVSGGECYYVSNVRASSPGQLFPTGNAFVYDSCETCSEAPCTDCNTANDAVVAGITTACWPGPGSGYSEFPDPVDFVGKSNHDDYCRFAWNYEDANFSVVKVRLKFALNDFSIPNTFNDCPPVAVLAGQAVIELQVLGGAFSDTSGRWVEITNGFTCNPVTGRVSGTHALGAPCDSVGICNNTPTVTVDP